METKGRKASRSIRQFTVIALLLSCCVLQGAAAETVSTAADDNPVVSTAEAGRDRVVEKTGSFLPLDIRFTDENGVERTLRALIDRPTLILPIYFYCPSSCSKNLANMAVAMNRMSFEPGRDYRAIALSFSETETPANATRAKQNYLKLLYDGFPADEWTFLTGEATAIKTVTDALGYRFKKLDDGTYIHPSAVIAIDADGKIIRYVYGSFVPGDMDMSISSALEGTPALSVKRFLEFCLNYDPESNKPIFFYVKIGVFLFFAAGVLLIFYVSKRRRTP